MLKAFRANLAADLIFFRRNRLVALVAVFTGFVWCTTLVPSLLFMSARDKFQLIKMLVEIFSIQGNSSTRCWPETIKRHQER